MEPLIPSFSAHERSGKSNLVTPLGTQHHHHPFLYLSFYRVPKQVFMNFAKDMSKNCWNTQYSHNLLFRQQWSFLFLTDGVQGLKGPLWVGTRFAAGAPSNHWSHNMSAPFFGGLDSWQRCPYQYEKNVVNVNQGRKRRLQFLHLLFTFYRVVSRGEENSDSTQCYAYIWKLEQQPVWQVRCSVAF